MTHTCRFGTALVNLASRYGVIAQHVCFQLNFHQAVLEDIAYADNANKPLSGFHRQVTYALLKHYFRHFVDRILRGADYHPSGH